MSYTNAFKGKRFRIPRARDIRREFDKIEAQFSQIESDIGKAIRVDEVGHAANQKTDPVEALAVSATRANRMLCALPKQEGTTGFDFRAIQKPSARVTTSSADFGVANDSWGPWRRSDGLSNGVFSRPIPFIFLIGGLFTSGASGMRWTRPIQSGKRFSTANTEGPPPPLGSTDANNFFAFTSGVTPHLVEKGFVDGVTLVVVNLYTDYLETLGGMGTVSLEDQDENVLVTSDVDQSGTSLIYVDSDPDVTGFVVKSAAEANENSTLLTPEISLLLLKVA